MSSPSLLLLDAWINELEHVTNSADKVAQPMDIETSKSKCNVESLLDTWILELENGGSKSKSEKSKSEKQKGEKAKGEKPKTANSSEPTITDIHAGLLEMRVGKLLNVWPHPDSDKLFCEEIDIGEGSVRMIASGLRAFYNQEELIGRNCIVLANLKPKKMGGFASNGMVMCASNDAHDQVFIIEPPPDAPVGSLVTYEGLDDKPASSAQEKKKKIFETCAPFFKTGENGVCQFKGIDFRVGEFGVCTAPVSAGYSIS